LKKILIERDIHKVLRRQVSFLDRSEMKVFTAASNDEVLQLHRAELMDLIILQLDMPGMSTEQLCSLIKKDLELRTVWIIIVCACDSAEMERSLRFGANAVVLNPVKPPLLLAKARQLLNVPWRETYRVKLSVSVGGFGGDPSFFHRSLNITTTGILIETNQTFKHGDRVVCSFVLPDATGIQATGEVVRTIKQASGAAANRYGIHFVDLAPEKKEAIENYLESKAHHSRPAVY
jgi:DNA-binding response OmpR family regulator